MKRSRIDALIMEQEKLDFLDRETIEGVQLKKLNALLRRERERGGFYSALPQRLDSLAQLASLPFTTENDLVKSAPAMLLLSQSRVQRVLTEYTSGTAGESKRVFYSLGDCENTVSLFAAGLGELIFPGGVTMICMPFSGEYGLGELIAQAIERLGATPLRLGAGLSYGKLKEAMDAYKPDSYVGMPTALLSLLRMCGKGSLQRALVSGDFCPRTVTEEIEAILGTKLFPHYGSREMGLAGAICCPAHRGMHLRENHVIAEIVDENGKVLPLGETGELVITTLGMEAMPLIRYRSGDRARIIPGPCPCGSEVLRLDDGIGRISGREMAELDDKLFAQKDIVDFKAEMRDGRLHIFALTVPSGVGEKPADITGGASVETRAASMDDRPLYMGKRRIEVGGKRGCEPVCV